jgi:PAT family beta-lactamase induction signal transducer AmpG
VPVIYKSFNFNNAAITFYTSLFTIPWLCKPAIAPLLETLASKKTLAITAQFLVAGMLVMLAISLRFNHLLLISGILITVLAIFASTYDLNSDGIYIVNLTPQAQAHFIGVRTLAYQIGKLACQGGLIFLAGYLMHSSTVQSAWQVSLLLLAAIIVGLAVYHIYNLPVAAKVLTADPEKMITPIHSFKKVFAEFLAIPHLAQVLIFTLIYNLAEVQQAKIVPLFLLDKINHGGLALSIEQIGTLYGGIGMGGMLIGALASGFLLAKVSIKQCLIPMTIVAGMTNAIYLVLSLTQVQANWLIGVSSALVQFGFGLSNGVYMLYLLNSFTKDKQYPMSLYAIGTALMGLSVMIGGASSGYLQSVLGYNGFFSWILLLSFCIVLVCVYNVKKVL